eukprot:g109.t1
MALGVVSLLLAGFDLATVDLPSRLAELESSARASFPSLSGEPSIEFSAAWKEDKRFTLSDHNLGLLRNGSVINVLIANSSCGAPDPTVFEVLSESPRVYYYPHFLSEHECDTMIRMGERWIKPSMVTADGGKVDTRVRSSQMTFLPIDQELEPVPLGIKRKAEAATKIRMANFETLQIQRYGEPKNGQHVSSFLSDFSHGAFHVGSPANRICVSCPPSRHNTYLRPGQDFYNPHVDSMYGTDRRIATMIFYLSDPVEGGETVFPWLQKNGTGTPLTNSGVEPQTAIDNSQKLYQQICNGKIADGVKIKPRKGAAVLFYSLEATGALDVQSIHSSCPMKKGVKWISQQWINEMSMQPYFWSTTLAYWPMDTLAKPADEAADGADAQRRHTPDMLHGHNHLYVDEEQGISEERAGKLLTQLQKSVGADGWEVLTLGSTLRMCSDVGSGLLMPLKNSRAFTLSAWVRMTSVPAAEEATVTIVLPASMQRTTGGALAWQLVLSSKGVEGNRALLYGPYRADVYGDDGADGEAAGPEAWSGRPKGLEPALSLQVVDSWQQLSVVVRNREPYHEYEQDDDDEGSSWSFDMKLYSQVFRTGRTDYDRSERTSVPLAMPSPTAGGGGSAGSGGGGGGGGRVCVQKSRGANFAEMFVFSEALEVDQLKHLNMVSNTAKIDREGFKGTGGFRKN